jgi:type VI secretion system protein VasI
LPPLHLEAQLREFKHIKRNLRVLSETPVGTYRVTIINDIDFRNSIVSVKASRLFDVFFIAYSVAPTILRRVFRMGKFHFSIVGALLLVTKATAFAEPPPKSQAEASRCATIVDDEKRLKCFDDAFSVKRGAENAGAKSSWSIIEGASPADNGARFSAGLVVGDAALILRCQEQKTEAAFSTRDTYLGDETVAVRYRIDLQEAVKEIWRSSQNGRAAFAPHPVELIRALPDNGRVFIRAIAADGSNKDANFQLSGVSEIRENVARACNWPGVADEPATGTVKPPQSR